MPVHTLYPTRLTSLACAALSLSCGAALAQTQVVKPAYTHYWMDVSTASMAGMDDMPGMGALASMMGGRGGSSEGSSFGSTKGMTPGRWLDIAVATQRKPAGTQALQSIPAGQNMGPSLTLLPVEATSRPKPTQGRDGEESQPLPEKPKGRILFYWGCGDTVRAGQPKVLDFSTAGPQDYANFMAGRTARQRGATATPGHSIWPNPQHKQSVPKGASLVGQHSLTGEGLPATLQFAIGSAQDIMPALALNAAGGGNAVTNVSWPAIPSAKAYFLNAMAGGDQEMVIWSSSELPEPGWGLMDYLGNANTEKWLGEKVLLPASQTRCNIPAGIFAKSDGAMVQGIAYGQDLHLVYPPRPTDPKVAWEQEWTAQVRVKSVAMMPMERGGDAAKMEPQKPMAPTIPGLPNLGNALKGLFGR
jgi:hypothetical protein